MTPITDIKKLSSELHELADHVSTPVVDGELMHLAAKELTRLDREVKLGIESIVTLVHERRGDGACSSGDAQWGRAQTTMETAQ